MISPYSVCPLFDSESSTWSYLIIDNASKEAAIIDSVIEQTERDLKLIKEKGLTLKYAIETHIHADHITGASVLKQKTGAQIAYGAINDIKGADIFLNDNDIIKIGNTDIKAIATPGHTSGCFCFYIDGAVFTGDTLFIRGCGRTDFQEGGAAIMYDSIHSKIFTMPDETIIYPGHDYNGQLSSIISEEKLYNPRLKLSNSKEDFIKIMDNLNLPYPKKIDTAVPANQKAGKQ